MQGRSRVDRVRDRRYAHRSARDEVARLLVRAVLADNAELEAVDDGVGMDQAAVVRERKVDAHIVPGDEVVRELRSDAGREPGPAVDSRGLERGHRVRAAGTERDRPDA